MLNRRYAGRFQVGVKPQSTVEEGNWVVDKKLLTPGNGSRYVANSNSTSEEPSLILSNPTTSAGQVAILRGPGTATAGMPEPAGRVLRLEQRDVADIFDILSVGFFMNRIHES